MTFGEAVAAAIKAKGLTIVAAAKAAGTSAANVSGVISGKSKVARDFALIGKLEDITGVPRGGLVKYLPAGHPAHRYYAAEAPPVVASGVGPAIPMAGRADGGSGQFREPTGPAEFFRPRKYPPGTVAVVVDGDSVSGYGVFGGDTVAVLPTTDEGGHDGCLVVSHSNQGYVVKRWHGGKSWSLRAGEVEPTVVPPDQSTRMFGVVIGVIEGERTGEVPKLAKKPRRK